MTETGYDCSSTLYRGCTCSVIIAALFDTACGLDR